MKKFFFFAAFAVFGLFSVNAQETNFGVKAGVDFASNKVEASGFDVTATETGFYIGAFVEISVSESFTLQPEVLYVSITDLNQIAIPLMAKFGVSDDFNVLVGPAISLILDSAPGAKSMNFGAEAGISYDFSEQFFAEARYNLGLANLIEDAPSGVSSKISGFFIGIGYRL